MEEQLECAVGTESESPRKHRNSLFSVLAIRVDIVDIACEDLKLTCLSDLPSSCCIVKPDEIILGLKSCE